MIFSSAHYTYKHKKIALTILGSIAISVIMKTTGQIRNDLFLKILSELTLTARMVKERNEGIFDVILFGSYAKNQWDVFSDIDIAIIGEGKNDSDSGLIETVRNSFQVATGKEIDVIYFPVDWETGNHSLVARELKISGRSLLRQPV